MIEIISDLPVSSLRQRMIDEMNMSRFARKTQSKHPVRAAGAQAVLRFGQRNGAEPRMKPRNAAWSGNATLKPGMPSTKNP